MAASTTDLHTLLADRVRRLGDQPLLTYYDTRTGERTELGWATCANWAAKAANMLEEAGVQAGDDVLVATDGHWTALVTTLACGLVGARAVLVDGAPAARNAATAVIHERWDAVDVGGPTLVVGPGLGGRPTGGAGPAFVEDVLACEDEHLGDEPDADAVWLVLADGQRVSRDEALRADADGGRVLLAAPLETTMRVAISVMAAGGSLVAVRGDDADTDKISASERCDRTVPGPT